MNTVGRSITFRTMQPGFTLVELVVVLVILAIIGAIIAPRLFDLAGPARFAAVKSLQASVNSAAQLANALQVSQGFTSGQSVTVEGNTIAMTNGFPTADQAGIVSALQYDTTVFATSGAGPIVFQTLGAGTPAACQVSYAAAAGGGAPAITLTASGSGCQ